MSNAAVIVTLGNSSQECELARRSVAGRELICHTLDHARAVKGMGQVVVACADVAIAEIARREGVRVELHPGARELGTIPSYLRERALDRAVVLDALMPLRAPDQIARAVEMLDRPGVSRVQSARVVRGQLWRSKGARTAILGSKGDEESAQFEATPSIVALRRRSTSTGKTLLLPTPDELACFRVESYDALDVAESIVYARQRITIRPLLRRVRLLVLDFDGVMTNNLVLVMQDGSEGVLCNRSDGLGIGMLKTAGLGVAVLSAETNPVVARRCEKLAIECLQGVKDKLAGLKRLLGMKGVDAGEVAYVGNDVNDVPCMDHVTARGGVAIAVADAHPAVRSHVQGFTRLPGGYGAVREVVDWILRVRQDSAEAAHA
jgi:YrbI family 3-deoxy-D-manno-octulosonate 8-phosphate phosphatase